MARERSAPRTGGPRGAQSPQLVSQDPARSVEGSAVDPGARHFTETWEQALAGFTEWLRAAGARPGTVELRLRYLRRLAAAHAGVSPWSLTLDDLVRFVSRPAWAPETRRCALSAARGLYRWGHRTGRRGDDPAALLPPVSVPHGRPKPCPEDVLEHALAAAPRRERAWVMLAAYAGLRRAEIATLARGDVGAGELRITGKGGKVRPVPIGPELAEALAPLVAAAEEAGRDYLFPGRDDGHVAPLLVGRAVAGLLPGRWTAHTLRHRYATTALAATGDLRAVQELLGHSKPETTARYTAVSDATLRRVALAAGPARAGREGDA